MKCTMWASILCLAVGPSFAAGFRAPVSEPVDCTEVAAKVDAQIQKAGASDPDLEISSLVNFELNDKRPYARSPVEALIKNIEGRGL